MGVCVCPDVSHCTYYVPCFIYQLDLNKAGGKKAQGPAPLHAEASRPGPALTRSGSWVWEVLPLTEACQPAAGTRLVPREHALL